MTDNGSVFLKHTFPVYWYCICDTVWGHHSRTWIGIQRISDAQTLYRTQVGDYLRLPPWDLTLITHILLQYCHGDEYKDGTTQSWYNFSTSFRQWPAKWVLQYQKIALLCSPTFYSLSCFIHGSEWTSNFLRRIYFTRSENRDHPINS